ncbi:metal-sensitive transcriptional regulator [Ureibacillus chungkukjangi]|uniref:metal-sensitive transcriptional regulator n=1 Tax=Ureibacillus chungkukjangi TaxID=1202712 RepID=UPI00203E119F|nr:metal-sensitive transcriptional regulator [Ureibacillus chungkukjangi]MCM3388267.1 metal-sensitive transcriptional regulator [Ureibacillus chungkukjangi]
MNHEINNEVQINEDSCCSSSSERKSHHSDETKKNLITRLNRVEGQIRGIKGLIEKDTYCDDVITQISAAQAALNGVAKMLLETHMKECVAERIQEGDLEVLDEVLITIQKLMKK